MAVTVTQTNISNDEQVWTITATADADVTTGAIAHDMGANAFFMPFANLSQALTALSGWTFAVTQTTWTGTKLPSTGSGNAAVQETVQMQRVR